MRDHTQAVKAVVCGDIIDNPSETESMLQHLRYVHSPTPAERRLYRSHRKMELLVKVGRWSGTLPSLRSRYLGQYGPDIQLVTFLHVILERLKQECLEVEKQGYLQ
jgi:hypothetical protein